jgi:UDP-2,3-diacylglucosamine hydrolase
MDVTQAEVDRVMNESGIDTLIHGHTHRPAVHQWVNEQGEKTRLVLGDWSDNSGWMIRWSPDTGLILSQFEF